MNANIAYTVKHIQKGLPLFESREVRQQVGSPHGR